MIPSMETILSEVLSPLMVDLWQLDRIRDLFESGFSIDEIADEVNLDPILVREVMEIKYPKLSSGIMFHFRLDNVSRIGPPPVFASCGTSPSPYFSRSLICLILSIATS